MPAVAIRRELGAHAALLAAGGGCRSGELLLLLASSQAWEMYDKTIIIASRHTSPDGHSAIIGARITRQAKAPAVGETRGIHTKSLTTRARRLPGRDRRFIKDEQTRKLLSAADVEVIVQAGLDQSVHTTKSKNLRRGSIQSRKRVAKKQPSPAAMPSFYQHQAGGNHQPPDRQQSMDNCKCTIC